MRTMRGRPATWPGAPSPPRPRRPDPPPPAEPTNDPAAAAVEAAAARLSQLRVLAPEPGVVLVRAVEPGDVVSPGKALLTLALDRETQILAQPDEKNLPALRVGQKARASADAFPDRSFPAEVISISPGVDVARGTVDVKLRVPAPPDELKTDMTLSRGAGGRETRSASSSFRWRRSATRPPIRGSSPSVAGRPSGPPSLSVPVAAPSPRS